LPFTVLAYTTLGRLHAVFFLYNYIYYCGTDYRYPFGIPYCYKVVHLVWNFKKYY